MWVWGNLIWCWCRRCRRLPTACWSLVSVLTAALQCPESLSPAAAVMEPVHFLSAAVSSLQQVTEPCCRWRLQAAALQASATLQHPVTQSPAKQVQQRQSTWRVKINMQPNTNHLGVGDLLFEVFTRLNPSVSWKLEPKNQSCSRYVFVKDV